VAILIVIGAAVGGGVGGTRKHSSNNASNNSASTTSGGIVVASQTAVTQGVAPGTSAGQGVAATSATVSPAGTGGFATTSNVFRVDTRISHATPSAT